MGRTNVWHHRTDGRVRKVRAGSTRDERYRNHVDWTLHHVEDDPAAATGETGPVEVADDAEPGTVGARIANADGTPAGEWITSHTGGGWYAIIDRSGQEVDKVQGREAAEARRLELAEADNETSTT